MHQMKHGINAFCYSIEPFRPPHDRAKTLQTLPELDPVNLPPSSPLPRTPPVPSPNRPLPQESCQPFCFYVQNCIYQPPKYKRSDRLLFYLLPQQLRFGPKTLCKASGLIRKGVKMTFSGSLWLFQTFVKNTQ